VGGGLGYPRGCGACIGLGVGFISDFTGSILLTTAVSFFTSIFETTGF